MAQLTKSGSIFKVSLGNTGGYKAANSRAGINGIVDSLKAFTDELEAEILPDVMVEALKPTLELSQKYVPVKTGALHDSGFVDKVSNRKGQIRAEIGYSKYGEAPYATIVHEVPHYHAPPTRYKFLEVALDEDYYDILTRIAQGLKSQTGS